VLSDVGAPQPLRGVGDEVALHQIVVHGRVRAAPAGLARSADAAQAGLAHQPGHALAGDRQAQAEAQLGVHSRSAVAAAAHLVHPSDQLGQLPVGDLAR